MAEESQGFHSLFSRLCEIAFASEAAKREDNYTKIRYTSSRRLKLQTCLYDRLFEELQAPWVGEGRKTERNVKAKHKEDDFNVYEQLAVAAFNLRLERRFDEADALEYNCAKWRSLPGKLKESVELSRSPDAICEPESAIRFVAALAGIGPTQTSPVLGHQGKAWTKDLIHKDLKRTLPEGPLLSTDSQRLREQALLEPHYVHYSAALFERVPVLGLGVVEQPIGVQTFDQIAGPTERRLRFFALQENVEDLHDERTRKSLFSALAHANTDDMQVRLGLPDLPANPTNKTFGLSTLSAVESPDDEGFHEVILDTSSELSRETQQSIQTTDPCTPEIEPDIWSAALQLTTQRFYTWEMEGRRDAAVDRPYITEAGPAVFDELYNSLNRQVSYLVWTPAQYHMVSIRNLICHSLNVLIGVPSAAYVMDQESLNFIVNESVRLSGCSPGILHSTLDRLASIGTDYLHVARFTTDESRQSGGLVLQAFIGGLRSFLQCYRATVLSVKASEVQSPMQLMFTFHSWGKQLRFLADMCMCSRTFRKHNGPKSKFPTGVKLLTYLYQLALEHSSTPLYYVLLSLLKHSCAPYIMFVQNWVFRGVCDDAFGEFIIEVDDQYLAYRDKHFWSHGFVMMGDDKLDCVPMFLSDLANDIFVCGKSINLLRLCCPEHFLCDSTIPPPTMEVTFSVKELKSFDQRSHSYVNAMEQVARKLREEREQKRLALDERSERAAVEEKERAEKALKEVTDLIEEVKVAVVQKKREDLKMLKEQMEQAIKQRELAKEEKEEEDKRFMDEAIQRGGLTTSAEEELKEKARQDLIKYYEELSQVMERREERAQWQIKRHQHDDARIRFFAQEQAKLLALQNLDDEGSKTETPPTNLGTNQTKQSTRSLTPVSRNVAVSTPSLVSLIASGIKTDALVKAEAKNDLDKFSAGDGGDPGVASATTLHVTTAAQEQKPSDASELSEGHTLVSLPTLDQDDDTDISVASSVGASAEGGRKKWSRPQDTESIKQENTGMTPRKAWEAPADGTIALAESQFPQGHPAESSIQFVMYGDKATSLQAEESNKTPAASPGIIPTHTSHPADSSLQSLMYPGPDSSSASMTGGTVTSDPVLEAALNEVASSPKPVHGHPSDATAQMALYQNQDGDMVSSTVPLLPHGHPSDSIAQMALYQNQDGDMVLSTVPLLPHGHPSDSTAQMALYQNQGGDMVSSTLPLLQHGHPSDSTAQMALYQNQDGDMVSSTVPLLPHGHPSDSSAQMALYQNQDGDTASSKVQVFPHGHPSDSSAQKSLYQESDNDGVFTSIVASTHGTDLVLQDFLQSISSGVSPRPTRSPRSAFGHPTDSTAKFTLYPTEDQVFTTRASRSGYGHPGDSSAQDYLYPPENVLESTHPRSHFGHPSDSQIQHGDSETKPDLVQPLSPYGHPSDSQLDNTDNVTQILMHRSRSQWGHPSNSSVQKVLGDISTVSETHQNVIRDSLPQSSSQNVMYPNTIHEVVRGTPPVERAKGILYPGEDGSSTGETFVSTRGHEPAVRITTLMYPGGPDEVAKSEPVKPLEFEDVWMASQVEPLRDNYDILDHVPSTDLLRGALAAVIEEKDTDESIDAAQLMSLPVLLQRSVTAPLLAQISLVNQAVVEYFMEELQVQRHFDVFRKFLFMEDGEFSLSMSDQLFEKLSSGATPRELCSTTVMNGIVTRALQLSVYADVAGLEQQLAFALKWMPDMLKPNDIDTFDFLELRYKVEWPVNIVITENSIIKYNKIFSFMLRLKRISWVLRDIWFHLKHIAFSRNAAGSSQLRQLQLFRHEMLHFVHHVEGYLSNQILNVTWAEFQRELATNVRNLDDLHHRHTEYLNKAIFRSLLSKKAAPVMKIMKDIFSLVLKLRAQLYSSPWQQETSGGHVIHPSFALMCATHKAFKDYSGFLFTVVSKLVRRGYQSHLEDFLLRLNFNGFYTMA